MSMILSLLQRKSSGKLVMLWRSSSFSRVRELLKHVAKNVFRSSAFLLLDCATYVPICKVEMKANDPLSRLSRTHLDYID